MSEIENDLKKLKLEEDDRKIKKVPKPISKKPKEEEIFFQNKIDSKLLKKQFLGEGKIEKEHVLKILKMAQAVLSQEPNLLQLQDPITVVGDIHGQFYDLVGIFEMCGEPSETNSFFFLGDYVDRGYFGVECVLLLLSYKVNFPKNLYMIRGNHECRHITKYFNFYAECLHKYDEEVYDEIMNTFDCLPLAATINYMFCVHGGISPKLVNIQDINSIDRFVEIPSIGPMCDLLWSDPMNENDENSSVQNQMFIPNTQRNCSYKYSYNAVSVFLKANNLLCILRAHEAEEKGYKFYKAIEKTGFPSVITVFSAPNYCDTYGNAGSVLQFINNDMNVKQFKCLPHPMVLPQHQNVFTWSIPFVSEKVCDIVYGVLSQCPIDEEEDSEDENISEESINSIRSKIVSLGKVGKMYNTIKHERESWLILKGMLLKSGKTHHLLLSQGSGAIQKAINNFEGAKNLDDDSRPVLGEFDFSIVKPENSYSSPSSNSGSETTLSPSKIFSEKDSPSIKMFQSWLNEFNDETKSKDDNFINEKKE